MLCSFAPRTGKRVIWYQMDQWDADPGSFFHFLAMAVEEEDPGGGEEIPVFTPEYAYGPETFAQRFFDILLKRLGSETLIVFDDCQEVPDNSQVFRLLGSLVPKLPSGVTLVFASRSPAPPSFAAAEAKSALLKINWSDLRFSFEEAGMMAALRDRGSRFDFSLYEKTRGWAAGLVLLLEGGRLNPHSPGTESFSAPEAFFDYFASEIFEKLDGRSRDALTTLSIMPFLYPEPARKLTGNDRAEELLEKLARENFFITRKEGEEHAYNFHPLVRDFLFREARKRYAPDEFAALEVRAAKLLNETGHPESAARILIVAKAWDEVVPIILANARALVKRGRVKLLEEWIEAVPQEVVFASPRLAYWRGLCRLPYDPPKALGDFREAFAGFERADDARGVFLCWAAMVEAILYSFSDFTRLDGLMEIEQSLEKRFSGIPPGMVEARVCAGVFLALLMRNPGHRDFEEWRQRALTLARKSNEPNLLAFVLYYNALDAQLRGNFPRAEVSIAELGNLALNAPLLPVLKLTLKQIETIQYNARAEHEECLKCGEEALQFAKSTGVFLFNFRLKAQMAWSGINCGDFATADRHMEAMERSSVVSLDWNGSMLAFLKAYKAHVCGEPARAREYAVRSLELAKASGSIKQLCNSRILLANIETELGNFGEAKRLVEETDELSRDAGIPLIYFSLRLSHAWLLYKSGEPDSALVELRHALAVGRKYGFTSTPVWQTEMMSVLCKKGLRAGIETEYVKKLVTARRLTPAAPPIDIYDWPWPIRIRAFGAFTIELDGRPVPFTGKVQKKPLQILKLLVASGSHPVSDESLASMVWPDSDGFAAKQSLNVTLHRLRLLLDSKDAILHEDGMLSLNPRTVWIDTTVFTRHLRKAEEAARLADAEEALLQIDNARELHRGPFMGGDTSEALFIGARETLREAVYSSVLTGGRAFENRGDWDRGVQWYSAGIELDRRAEGFYQRLMRCQAQL
jgi:ATP/maltotriose-dependent transcriptional regulator MalT/DNA-binding SARP family transcriptional activator